MNDQIFKRLLTHVRVSQLAAEFDISNSAVAQWRTKRIPLMRVIPIEKLINGAMKRDELRPDFPWYE